MREILFRGKDTDSGKWVEGSLWKVTADDYCIISHGKVYTITNLETIGEYTGLKDKNGKRIFTGDILESYLDDIYPENVTRVTVVHTKFGRGLRQIGTEDINPIDETDEGLWTVIGNIHDNPELLEG